MISVVIPCYNEQRFICRLLKSLEQQSAANLIHEIIVVDNASTDNTKLRAEEFAKLSRIPIKIATEPVLGVSRAKNKGALLAKSSTLLFLDADVTASPGLIEEVCNRLNEGYVAGTIRNLSGEPDFIGKMVFRVLEVIKCTVPRPFGKAFVMKDAFLKVGGYNEHITLGENLEFLLKVRGWARSNGKQLTHIKSPIYSSLRRFRSSGYTSTLISWLAAYAGNYRQVYPTLSEICADQDQNTSA